MAKLERAVDAAKYGTLDSGLKSLYTQQGDKYVLDVDDSPAMAALESERQAKKTLEDQLKAFGGFTPDQVKALADAKAKAEREKDFAAGNVEKILAEERDKRVKDAELAAAEKKRLEASLERALIREEAVRAITEHNGNPELLMPIIEKRARLEVVEDRHVAIVLGEKGGPLLKAGAQKADEFMPLSEFVGSVLKSDKRYAGAFDSKAGSGTGGTRPVGTPRAQSRGADEAARAARVVQALRDGASVISE